MTNLSLASRTEGNQSSVESEAVSLSLETKCLCPLKDISIALEENLDSKEKDLQSETTLSAVTLHYNGDGHLLQCAKPEGNEDQTTGSIFGIEENQSLFRGVDDTPAQDEGDLTVKVEVSRPALDSIRSIVEGCSYQHPCSDWTRRPLSIGGNNINVGAMRRKSLVQDANIDFVDLTYLQKLRRRNGNFNFQIDSPGKVCHLLRSTLRHSGQGDANSESSYDPHFASPWSQGRDSSMSDFHLDCVIGILLCNQLEDDDTFSPNEKNTSGDGDEYWNTLEKKELFELCRFRTGDACPSFYMYSISKLKSNFVLESLMNSNSSSSYNSSFPNIKSENGYTLVIYRLMPQRHHLMDSMSNGDTSVKLPKGCLFEQMRVLSDGPESQEVYYRIVAPPYQCHEDIYPGLLKDLFMNSTNIESVVNEAKRIPLWTAWPERNHYRSDYDNSENSDPNDDSLYPPSWTVFPLCHTFPASDPSATKWISKTCAFVPETTRLLKALGPTLRTALFSRLEPRTTLGSHNGWADLANHVLRVHIPLVIPSGGINDGLCGTWVDGLVENHQMGKIICFDDSKTHRAFNYSDEERIVLIIDLVRSGDNSELVDFPGGTASGGHTNELDAFIEQFS